MSIVWIRVVDSDFRQIANATVRAMASDGHAAAMALPFEDERWVGQSTSGKPVTIRVDANGFEAESHKFTPREGVAQVVIGLRKPGQLSYSYGNDRLAFSPI